ncbi:MAG: esterase [Candidatus Accumulibacter sp.]|nr:esterase [Accumulibacter sp.]
MRRLGSFAGLCCLLLAALPLRAAAEAEAWSAVVLPAAQQLDMRSAGSGHRYRIFVSVPAVPPPAAGYPVLYVLDGNAAFPVAAFLARSATNRRDVTGHPPPLVVGIGYPGDADFDVAARRRDYTVGLEKPDASAKEGGAELFLDFIERELKPLIAARHPVDTTRQALFGHSFGGLFVLHVLFTRPASFSTYLASSPSIWWDDKRVLGGLPGLARLDGALQPRVQISVGALEDQPRKGKYPLETLAMLAKRPMVSEARKLASHLREMPGWGDRGVYHELAGEDHGPAWLPAMIRGMPFFLEQP